MAIYDPVPPLPWTPSGAQRHKGPRPPEDALIALERAPWRVLEVREVDPVDYTPDQAQAYEQVRHLWPDPYAWPKRPWTLVVVHPQTRYRRHLRFDGGPHEWYLLSEHYAVCVECKELHPCHHLDIVRQVESSAQALERVSGLGAGDCWGCGQPIEPRARSITFEGDNLIIPGGPSPVRFHTRFSCHGEAARYEQLWVEQDPRRVATLTCAGSATEHRGSFDCTLDPGCPGPRASHRAVSHHNRFRAAECPDCPS